MSLLDTPSAPYATTARVSSLVAAALSAVVVAFQLALALGAPWGRAAYGGAVERPDSELRAASVVAAVVWSCIALIVLRRGGHRAPRLLPDRALPAILWVIIGLLAVGLVLNLVTPSALERSIWAPVAAALVVATTATEIAARRRGTRSKDRG